MVLREFPLDDFTLQENRGHDLFYAVNLPVGTPVNIPDDGKFGNCAFCHSDNPVIPFLPAGVPQDDGTEPFQLYSAQDFHNIGAPKNYEIPDTGVDPDLGFAGHALDAMASALIIHSGFSRRPSYETWTNVKEMASLKHTPITGCFKSLESIVHFYNTADVGSCNRPWIEGEDPCGDRDLNHRNHCRPIWYHSVS